MPPRQTNADVNRIVSEAVHSPVAEFGTLQNDNKRAYKLKENHMRALRSNGISTSNDQDINYIMWQFSNATEM